MRINILAFALGVGLLQIQERLPALPLLAGMLLGLGALFLLARRQPLVARTLTALICALLGLRLGGAACRTAAAGAVAGRSGKAATCRSSGWSPPCRMPSNGASVSSSSSSRSKPRGRFVPQRIMLSWYHGRLEDEWREGTGDPPGRALALHGSPETSARQRQSAWLRLRGLALRARPAGNRLRASAYATAQRLDDFVWRPGLRH
jgi:hypothetical protein